MKPPWWFWAAIVLAIALGIALSYGTSTDPTFHCVMAGKVPVCWHDRR